MSGETVPTITITIGRNIGQGEYSTPMAKDTWKTFKHEVRDLTVDLGVDLWVDADYTGRWQNVNEDAHVFHGGQWLEEFDQEVIKKKLEQIRIWYNQDAIGLAFGQGELVQ